MRTRSFLAVVAGSLLASVAVTAQSRDAIRVFFASQARGADGGIYSARLDRSTGELDELERVAPLTGTGFLAIEPRRRVLYATTRGAGEGGVAAFWIDGADQLVARNRESAGGHGTCHVSVDRRGRCVLLANYGSGSVAARRLVDDGAIGTALSAHAHEGQSVHPRRQQRPHAHSIYAGPDNRFAYAPDLGIDRVVIYRLDSVAGTLAPAGSAAVPPGSGPRHMKFGRAGRFAYVLNELTLTVSVFARDAESGALTAIETVPVLPMGADPGTMSCSEIRVHPNGRFVYTANRDLTDAGRDSLSVLAVRDDGRLEYVDIVSAEVRIPRNFTLDPSGRWLLVAGQKSNEIAVFGVDASTGKLTFAEQKAALPAPMCVAFLPPISPRAHDQRGDEHLKAGRFELAIAEFDRCIASEPRVEPHHWRRGIAYYYAGRYADGVQQFEVHRGVNPADVENAAWHFLCKARLDGVDAARAALLPVGRDGRAPMGTVYELFAGRAQPADVERAARAATRQQAESALFYAHLYLGLYHEALGDAERARKHITIAATEHTSPHYMGDVARVHKQLLDARDD